MKFSHLYTKLNYPVFTTIRQNKGYYKTHQIIDIETPINTVKGEILSIQPLQKEQITTTLAFKDADCSKEDLIKMLENWYGKKYNDFILLTIAKL